MPAFGSNSLLMIVLRWDELATSQADESVNDAPKPVIDWYVVPGLIVIVCEAEPLPVAKVAPLWGASSLDWSAVVSVTATAAPAAWAGPGEIAASAVPASAAAPTEARMVLKRTMGNSSG